MKWGMKAVYKIIADDRIQQQRGQNPMSILISKMHRSTQQNSIKKISTACFNSKQDSKH